MKKNWIVLGMALFGMLILLVSCGGGSENPQYSEGQELTLTGKMKIIDNDGTFYVLVTDQNEFFELLNVSDEYKKDGVPINAVVNIKKLVTLTRLGPACEVKEYLE
jgi:hypothetical protein